MIHHQCLNKKQKKLRKQETEIKIKARKITKLTLLSLDANPMAPTEKAEPQRLLSKDKEKRVDIELSSTSPTSPRFKDAFFITSQTEYDYRSIQE